MKLLVGSDLHNNARAKVWFCELADQVKPEVVVFLGDFITFEPLSFARDVMRDIASFGVPTLVIPGNCDPREVLLQIDQVDGITNLHNHSLQIGGLQFTGKGGSITCPSPTPFEEPDEGFTRTLEPLMEGTDILVLHQPVRGFRDQIVGVGDVGSESLLKLVSEHRPRLVLSGHIHEAKGLDVWGKTYFVNPGALLEMNAAVIDVSKRIRVEFKQGNE
jgi:Icc-related predicted phosphoesterase